MKLSTLKGLPVINLAGGTKVGAVRDAQVDTTGLRVAALLMSGDGASGRAPAEGWHSLRDLRNLRVVDDAGTHLGEVQELDFDPTDGRVGELLARRGGMPGRGESRSACRPRRGSATGDRAPARARAVTPRARWTARSRRAWTACGRRAVTAPPAREE